MPFLKQSSRAKKATPPISPDYTQGNQKKTKPSEPNGPTRPVSVDKNKQTEQVATGPPDPPLGNGTNTQHGGSSWSTVKSKTTATKEDKIRKAKVSVKSLFESDSKNNDNEDSNQAFVIPEQNPVYLLSTDYSATSRFSMTFDIDTTLEPDNFFRGNHLPRQGQGFKILDGLKDKSK